MTYRVTKARIELNCDYCCARTSFNGKAVSECIREAKSAGWRLRRSANCLTNLIAEMRELTCECPGCIARVRKA